MLTSDRLKRQMRDAAIRRDREARDRQLKVAIRGTRPRADRRFDPVEDRVTAWQARYHEARRALGHRS